MISRTNILDEYFKKSTEWKAYFETALQIRTYRNVVVHNTQIASLHYNEQLFVPKRKKISDYKKWHQVFSVAPDRFQHDFVERNFQMQNDFEELKERLNLLWVKPLVHFHRLLYKEGNKKLLTKYDIEFFN